jgi:hypothetical protein
VAPDDTMAAMVRKRERERRRSSQQSDEGARLVARRDLQEYFHDYSQRFLKYREDERHIPRPPDFSARRTVFLEIGSGCG